MKITDVNLRVLKRSTSKLLAFADLIIDESLVIKNFQVFDSVKGLMVGMPSIKNQDGTWSDIVFPIDSNLKDSITTAIIRAYEDETNMPETKNRARS